MEIMEQKTIKQVADELGVSKDKIKYRVGKIPPNYLVKVGKVIYIKSEGIQRIAEMLGKNYPVLPSENYPTLPDFTHLENTNKLLEKELDILNEQLKTKDEQIKQLNKLLEENQKLLDQQQQLNAMTVKQLEDTKKQLEDKKEDSQEEKKWYEFWK